MATTGWRPGCDCGDPRPPVPAVCLDPFAGTGTVGVVASRLGRDSILVELKPEYADIAERKLRADAPMFASVAMGGGER